MEGNVLDMGKPTKRPQYPIETTFMLTPPDVGLFCSKCREFIQITKVRDHRATHKALNIFGYRKMSQVKSLDQLSKKRVQLQQSISKEHKEQYNEKIKGDKTIPPGLRAPGRPRPPNCLDTVIMAKREYLLIDEAYQIIKDYCFYEKSPFILKPKADVRHCVGLPSLTKGLNAIGVASEQNESYKPTMEDFRVLSDPFGPSNLGACFFGIFDGYNGTKAASYVSKSIAHTLSEELGRVEPALSDELSSVMELEDSYSREMNEKAQIFNLARSLTANILNLAMKFRPTAEDTSDIHEVNLTEESLQNADYAIDNGDFSENLSAIKIANWRRAMAKALVRADENLAFVEDEVSLVRWSGCSGTIGILISGKHFYENPDYQNDMVLLMANCGNCHAMIVDESKPRMLSEDHTINNPNEIQRVVQRGGKVTGNNTKKMVAGLLSTTRGLGNYGQPELRKSVSCTPFTTYRRLSQSVQLIVLGTPGLWSVLSKSEITAIAMQTVTYCVTKEKAAMSAEVSNTGSADNNIRIQISETNNAEMAEGTIIYAEIHDEGGSDIDKAIEDPESMLNKVEEKEKQGQADLSTWWKKELTEDISHIAAETLHSTNLENVPAESIPNGEESIEENSSEQAMPSTLNVDRFYSQYDVDTAKTIALNLASAALLAGSQDNITIQVLLLPNYRSLAEIHEEPVIEKLPNVPTSLQFHK